VGDGVVIGWYAAGELGLLPVTFSPSLLSHPFPTPTPLLTLQPSALSLQ